MRFKKKLDLDNSKERTVAGDAENEPDHAGTNRRRGFILRTMNLSIEAT